MDTHSTMLQQGVDCECACIVQVTQATTISTIHNCWRSASKRPRKIDRIPWLINIIYRSKFTFCLCSVFLSLSLSLYLSISLYVPLLLSFYMRVTMSFIFRRTQHNGTVVRYCLNSNTCKHTRADGPTTTKPHVRKIDVVLSQRKASKTETLTNANLSGREIKHFSTVTDSFTQQIALNTGSSHK